MAKPRDKEPVIHTKKHIARLERERRQTRMILIAFIAILVSVAGLITYALVYPKYILPNRAVAKVGNVPITVGEWQARVRMYRTQLINQMNVYQQYTQIFGMDMSSQIQQLTSQLNDSTTLGQTVLDQMIDEELIRQEAARRGITASAQEVDQAIQSAYQYFPNGSPTPTITPTSITFPTLSPETLKLVTITPTPTEFMTATSTPTLTPTATFTPNPSMTPTATTPPTSTPTSTLTPTAAPTDTPQPTSTPFTYQAFQDEYNQGVQSAEKLGLTAEQVRQLYATNILRQKLFNIITADVPRTQDEVWARHILVADEATAETIRQQLVNGADFAALAAKYSIDTATKDKGGDLGWFAKGVMVPEFEQVAFSMKVGEISQPVKTQFGYHIIQVLAHEVVPLDASAYSQAQQTAFKDWLKGLRTTYNVQTFNIWQNIVPTDPAIPASAQ
jgi:peptidyl-prolyl cis-trans isomerase D